MTYRSLLLAAGLGLQGLAMGSAAMAASPAKQAEQPAAGAALLTPYQLETEREILRIMNSAPMKAEIARVEALYAADPQGKTAAGKATIRRAAHSIAMAATQYAAGEDTDRPGAFWTVNAPHTWGGLAVPRSGYGIDNPDNVYRNIMVDAAARYEIHGQVKKPGPAELHFEMRDAIPGTTEMTAEGADDDVACRPRCGRGYRRFAFDQRIEQRALPRVGRPGKHHSEPLFQRLRMRPCQPVTDFT